MLNLLYAKEGRAATEVPTSIATTMAGNSVMAKGMVTSAPHSGSPADYLCMPSAQRTNARAGTYICLLGAAAPLLW